MEEKIFLMMYFFLWILALFQSNWPKLKNSHVWLCVTPWTAAYQASLYITNFQSLLKLMSISLVMPFNHPIFCHPLLFLPSILPSSRVFSNDSVLHIGWSKYQSFIFSISLANEYSGLISLRIDYLYSLLSKGLSRVFSNTTERGINFSVLSLLYGPTLTSIHDYWKNQSFDYMDHLW